MGGMGILGIVGVFGLLVLLSPGGSAAEPATDSPWAVTENAAFRVETPPDRAALGPALLVTATRARSSILKNTRVDVPFQTTIRFCETEDEFSRATGFRPESVVAAASSRQAMIWINGPAWQRTGPSQSFPILTHEYAHVVVGRLAPVRLPRWADEGLAMHLAGQWTLADGFAASKAQLFGGLPSLPSIEETFPTSDEAMRRAYLMSYMSIEFLARRLGAKPDNVDPILERLQAPGAGTEFAKSLWEPMTRAQIQTDALAALGHTARKWVIYLTSGATIWIFVTLLFLYAWWRKRRLTAAAQEEEKKEEAWTESLTEADIIDIYGEPQDTLSEDNDGPEDYRPEEDNDEKPWE